MKPLIFSREFQNLKYNLNNVFLVKKKCKNRFKTNLGFRLFCTAYFTAYY